jgi:hypothetical protein
LCPERRSASCFGHRNMRPGLLPDRRPYQRSGSVTIQPQSVDRPLFQELRRRGLRKSHDKIPTTAGDGNEDRLRGDSQGFRSVFPAGAHETDRAWLSDRHNKSYRRARGLLCWWQRAKGPQWQRREGPPCHRLMAARKGHPGEHTCARGGGVGHGRLLGAGKDEPDQEKPTGYEENGAAGCATRHIQPR